jgi:17beta-estradiol 17-dehydrogenase/3beta-hydroxysteroid 3-dehydrogenase/mitotic-spindle organizing protein 1
MSISQEGNSKIPSKRFSEWLEMLRKEFQARFQDFEEYSQDISLFQNPFTFEMEETSEIYQLELIDTQTDDELKETFHSSTREQFYKCLSDSKFPNIKGLATKMLTVFGSTYICEQTFSRMKFIKSKFRTRMSDDHLHHYLRISVTNFPTDINLAAKLQPQASHKEESGISSY